MLGLSFGKTKSLEGVTIDQMRRFADTARLPMKPVMDIVRDTVEKTQRGWKELPQKDLLPHDILKVIDGQIANAISNTKVE